MSFKVKVQTHAVWPVKVNLLAEQPGKTDVHKFFVRFKRLSEDEFNALSALGQRKLLEATVEAVGDDEQELEDLTPETLDSLLKQTNYRVGLYESYIHMDAGVAVKN